MSARAEKAREELLKHIAGLGRKAERLIKKRREFARERARERLK
jgi:hypothetical protein